MKKRAEELELPIAETIYALSASFDDVEKLRIAIVTALEQYAKEIRQEASVKKGVE